MRLARRFLLGVRSKKRVVDDSGQMAVELAVAFPVMLVVALIALNALTFFSECAAFDAAFREGVRLYCASPGYGQDGTVAQANLETHVRAVCAMANEEISSHVEQVNWGYSRYVGELRFRPTIFSHELNPSVFGVALPALTHEVSFVVDRYKPGVVL